MSIYMYLVWVEKSISLACSLGMNFYISVISAFNLVSYKKPPHCVSKLTSVTHQFLILFFPMHCPARFFFSLQIGYVCSTLEINFAASKRKIWSYNCQSCTLHNICICVYGLSEEMVRTIVQHIHTPSKLEFMSHYGWWYLLALMYLVVGVSNKKLAT